MLLQRAVRLKDKLRDATSTPPAFWPVWTRGQKLNFKQSWSWDDASQITSSSSAISSFTPSLCLLLCPVPRCVGSLAGAPLFSSDTQQSDVTHWSLRWQPGKTRSHSHLLLTGNMHSSFWQACTVHEHTLMHWIQTVRTHASSRTHRQVHTYAVTRRSRSVLQMGPFLMSVQSQKQLPIKISSFPSKNV